MDPASVLSHGRTTSHLMARSATCRRTVIPFQNGFKGARGLTPMAYHGSRVSAADEGAELSRRALLMLPTSLFVTLSLVEQAQAISGETRGIGRYIRRRALEPLEIFVPKVLAARSQLELTGEVRLQDPVLARDMLRTGAFYSLREDIRAIGEYAVTSNTNKDGSKLVDSFFLKLQTYDRALSLAVREQENGSDASTDADKVAEVSKETGEKLVAVLSDMNALLASVPADVMEKGEEMLKQFVAAGKEESAAESAAKAEEIAAGGKRNEAAEEVDDALLARMLQ